MSVRNQFNRDRVSFIAFFFLYYGTTAITVVFMPLLLKSKGLSPLEIGGFLSTAPLVTLVMQPLWGMAADRSGKTKLLLLSAMCGLLLAMGLLLGTEDKMLLLACYLMYTLFSCPIIPMMDAWNFSYCEQKGDNYGSFRLWGSLGFAAMSICFGLFAVGAGEAVLFSFFAASIVLAAAALVWIRPVANAAFNKKRGYGNELLQVLKDKRVWVFALFLLLAGVPARSVDSFYGIILEGRGASSVLIGVGWALACLSEVPVFASAQRWIVKRGSRFLMTAAVVFYCVRWALPLASDHPGWMVGIQLLHGLTNGLLFIAAMHYMKELVPSALRASGQTLLMLFLFTIPGILGNSLGGWMLDGGHETGLFVMASLLSLGAALVWWLTTPKSRGQPV
jgi:PPP family 3-phenylpropionic acid transporter